MIPTPSRRDVAAAAFVIASGCGPMVGVEDAGAPDTSTDAHVRLTPTAFCSERERFECARDLAAGRIDMTQFNACNAAIEGDCRDFAWPEPCDPTRDRMDACIAVLSDSSRIGTRTDLIVECTIATLCMP